MTKYIGKPIWWVDMIDEILSNHYDYDDVTPFDINSFKALIPSYTTAYLSDDGRPWDPSLCDIDLVIGIINGDPCRTYMPGEARNFVLNHQWSDTEPKRYRELGMVCPCGRYKDTIVYMRVANADRSDKSGIGHPRAGCCGSEEVLVLNPMPEAYAAKIADQHVLRYYRKHFKELNSDQKAEVLADVRKDRKALVMQWLSWQREVKKAEAGVGNKDGPKTLQNCKDELLKAKKRLEEVGDVFLWNRAYDDMEEVPQDSSL